MELRISLRALSYFLKSAVLVAVLSACSSSVLIHVSEDERKSFVACLAPESIGQCNIKGKAQSISPPAFAGGKAKISNPFDKIVSDDLKTIVSDLSNPKLAQAYVFAFTGNHKGLLKATSGSAKLVAGSLTGAGRTFQLNSLLVGMPLAASKSKLKAAVNPTDSKTPARSLLKLSLARRYSLADSVMKASQILQNPKAKAAASDVLAAREALEADLVNQEMAKLSQRLLSASADEEVAVSFSAGGVRNYFNLARKVTEQDAWGTYEVATDLKQIAHILKTGDISAEIEDKARFARFTKAYVKSYFRNGEFIKGYFFQDDFKEITALYDDLVKKVPSFEDLPKEFADRLKKLLQKKAGQNQLYELVQTVLKKDVGTQINEAVEETKTEMKAHARSVSKAVWNGLPPDIQGAVKPEIDKLIDRHSYFVKQWFKKIWTDKPGTPGCFAQAGKTLPNLIDECFQFDENLNPASVHPAVANAIADVKQSVALAKAALAKADADFKNLDQKIRVFLADIQEKLIVGKIGKAGFVARNGKTYQFPPVEIRVNASSDEKISISDINYIGIGVDLVRVLAEAGFDSWQRLPGVSKATGVKLSGGLPDANKVLGKGGYEYMTLADFRDDLPPRTIPRFKLDLTPLEGRADTAVAPMSRRPDRAFPVTRSAALGVCTRAHCGA